MPAPLSRFEGCLLGLALGDALGAPYEGGFLERATWRFIGRTRGGRRRFTDDTQMTLDLAESLLAWPALDPDDLAARFAASYRWSRGYGGGAARLLKRIRAGEDWRRANKAVFPDGSFGNGAAMRAPIVGVCFADDPGCMEETAQRQALITHAHPLGVEGAVVVAHAARLAISAAPAAIAAELLGRAQSDAFRERLAILGEMLSTRTIDPGTVRARLGNGVKAVDACPAAIAIALCHFDASFEDLLQFAIRLGGDVDTIAAMAGAIWGARNGVDGLPAHSLARLESADHIRATAGRLHERFGFGVPGQSPSAAKQR